MSGRPSEKPASAWLDTEEHLQIASTHELRHWLAQCGQRHRGLWVVTWMKRPGLPYVGRWEVLDELLCQGWIDGARRRVDAQRTAQWIAPRRHDSWTATYRQRFAALVEQGRVCEAGFAAMQAAVDAGTWLGLPDVDRLKVPADLGESLASQAQAMAWFMAQAPSYRRNVLRWLAQARRPQTRMARIAAITAASAGQQRLRHL